MKTKLILSVIWTISCFVPKSQASDKFKLRINNNSDYTTICTIAGNDKVDSVLPHREKTILFQLEKNQPSFYLDLWSEDQSPNSYKYTRIRILNEESSKKVNITSGNRLEYSLNPAEKIIAAYNPRPRTRNFWKLDSVINKNADNIAGGEIIFMCLCDIDVKLDTIRKYYNFLTPSVKSSAYGKRITNYIEARNRLNAGNKMIDIELADTTGKLVSLDKIKSDYILLDFWFSRCTPCIQSFPTLQELYKKTDRKQFEIVGISIDRLEEKDLWKAAIKKYNLSWINLNDPKASIASKLAIVNYPTKVLVGKNGKILLVDTDNSYENFYKEIEKMVKVN